MFVDAHAYITQGLHGSTGAGRTRSLPYGCAQHGDQVVRVLPPLSAERTALEPETLLRLMDWVAIDKTVLMQGPFYGDQNTFLYQTTRRWPDRFAAAAYLDPHDQAGRDTFRRVTEEYGFRILKFEMSELTGLTGLYPDLRINGEELAWYWEQADRLELAVTLNLGWIGTRSYQTDAVEEVATRYRRARIVIAHLAHPPLADAGNERNHALWREQILLGRHENIWFDTSSLPALGVDDYPFPTALRYIRQAVELVGAEKLMWGSDIPTMLCHATYQQLLNMLALRSGLDEQQLERILGETARRVYSLTA